MKNKITKDYFNIMQYGQPVDTPLFSGITTLFSVDDALTIEKQNVTIKQDFLFEDSFKGDHLEFTFPIEGQVELEINQKYMHSKAHKDLFSLAAFEHNRSSVYAKRGEMIKHLAINLKRNIYFKDFAHTKQLTKGMTNLYKVSGNDKYIDATVRKLYGENGTDSLAQAEMRYLVYELVDYCVAKIMGNINYHKCISKADLQTVKQIRKYIDRHFLEKLTLYQISSLSLSNEFKIKKTYREVYGETVFETIRKKRMDYALQLMAGNAHSLNEIAHICGYQSYPSFYKSFKKYFSYSPSDL